jgi:hypothetical protein
MHVPKLFGFAPFVTVLPVDWIAYPGFHIANADNMVTVDDGNSCVEVIQYYHIIYFDICSQCTLHSAQIGCNDPKML